MSSMKQKVKLRQSNIELFRILLMISLVASHYVHNSGLLDRIYENPNDVKSMFLVIIGWFGKPAINCFVLITGYYMCMSEINIKKHFKLILEVEFYNIIIYLLFTIFSPEVTFSVIEFVKACIPLTSITRNFVSCYIVFYFLIPYINILIRDMDNKQHGMLLLLLLIIYTVIDPLPGFEVSFSYVSWFFVIYLLGAYIRLHPMRCFEQKKLWGGVFSLNCIISIVSIFICLQLSAALNVRLMFFFIEDSNKIFALTTSVAAFLFFKNVEIKYSRVINTMARSTIGVLLIHANSDIMRQWLWGTLLRCKEMWNSDYLYIHALISIPLIYVICVIIDIIRIECIEEPFVKMIRRKKEK